MADNKYVIDGFVFKTKEEYLQAKNEYEGVSYMRSRTNMNNAANVFSVYKSLVEEMPIPVVVKNNSKGKFGFGKSKDTLTKSDVIKNMKKYDIESVYRNRFISAVFVIIFLVIVMVFMLFITKNSKNTNIMNYKSRIDAEYEDREDSLIQWQNQLQLREEAVKEKEKELENVP